MKHIFIGDIHGKVERVKDALSRDGKKIFVGDFMDSFDRTSMEHRECLVLVLDAIERGEAEAIYGNHELSYLMPATHRCSGYSVPNEQTMFELRDRIEKSFRSHLMLSPEFIVTHAGITNSLWKEEGLTMDGLADRFRVEFKDPRSWVHFIGRARGGPNYVGGPFWCDFRYEFAPVPGLSQIFGHTCGQGLRFVENSYCIDCNAEEFLELDL